MRRHTTFCLLCLSVLWFLSVWFWLKEKRIAQSTLNPSAAQGATWNSRCFFAWCSPSQLIIFGQAESLKTSWKTKSMSKERQVFVFHLLLQESVFVVFCHDSSFAWIKLTASIFTIILRDYEREDYWRFRYNEQNLFNKHCYYLTEVMNNCCKDVSIQPIDCWFSLFFKNRLDLCSS